MKTSDIQVTYLNHMGSDLDVVNAARVSFAKESDWVRSVLLPGSYNLSEADQKLIKYLADHEHWSPFAHCSVSFRVKAPIFVARQLVKHTVGFAWNEVSRRYVDDEPEFYFPEVWRKRSESAKQGSSEEEVDLAPIESMFNEDGNCLFFPKEVTISCLETYEALLDMGVCPEQARMILPQNTMTEWVWTGSLYAWARMCHLRLDSHTQKETQEVAKLINDKLSSLYPVSWKALLK